MGFAGAILELPTVYETIHWNKKNPAVMALNEIREDDVSEFMDALSRLGKELKAEHLGEKGRIFGVKVGLSSKSIPNISQI